MNYNTLRTAIASAINTPANPRISGAILQQQLIGIVNALDMGALYLGMAGPNTTPNAEANGFYFATQAGTYTNFLNSGATAITVSNGEIALLVRSGKAWAKEHMMTMPYIDPTTKHWIVDGLDSGVVAEGQEGQNAYVYIMYAASLPTADADMHSTPQAGDKWIGVYSGNLKEAPTTYNSYVWSKYVGEDGNSIGSFKYKSYDADAAADLVDVGDTTTEDIGGLSASQNTLDVIVLMPNAASSPTKTMMIATQDDGNNGYEFVYIGDLQEAIVAPTATFSTLFKNAIVSLFSKVVYTDNDAAQLISNLIDAMNDEGEMTGITAVFTQPSDPIYNFDNVESLIKENLVVKAVYESGYEEVIQDYELSGSMNVGNNTYTVSYLGFSATFQAVVSEKWSFAMGDGLVEKVVGSWQNNGPWGGSNNMVYFYNNPTTSTPRRSFVMNKGKVTVKESNKTGSENPVFIDTNYYMIPIPATATKVTIALSPNSQYFGANLCVLDSDGIYRFGESLGAWQQGSFDKNLTAGQYGFLAIQSKYDNAGTSYPTEPTALTVVFSNE